MRKIRTEWDFYASGVSYISVKCSPVKDLKGKSGSLPGPGPAITPFCSQEQTAKKSGMYFFERYLFTSIGFVGI